MRLRLRVTDDFSGLAPRVKSLFPNTDPQLCCVHLFRNAQRHLSPEDYAAFKNAQAPLRHPLDRLRPNHKSYVEHLEKRTAHYRAFLPCPAPLHPHLRSTNLPEGINPQIENLHRHAGGHCPSEREALFKMNLLADQLYATKWYRLNPRIKAHWAALPQRFRRRFESELNPERSLTQSF